MADLLVVDDDQDATDLLCEVLRLEGHEVRVAADGRRALALLALQVPDLVILDVEMPVLTGPQMAYEMFLHNCGDEKVPIILLSGVRGLSGIAAAVGTPYFLAKPYTLDTLLGLLAWALHDRYAPCPTEAPHEGQQP